MQVDVRILADGFREEIERSIDSGNFRQVTRDIARVIAAMPENQTPVSRTDVLMDILNNVPEQYLSEMVDRVCDLVDTFPPRGRMTRQVQSAAMRQRENLRVRP